MFNTERWDSCLAKGMVMMSVLIALFLSLEHFCKSLTERLSSDMFCVLKKSRFEEHVASHFSSACHSIKIFSKIYWNGLMRLKFSSWTREANQTLISAQIIGWGETPQCVGGIRVVKPPPATAIRNRIQASAVAADHQVKYCLGLRVLQCLD